MRSLLLRPSARQVVFAVCLLPLLWLVQAAAWGQLGANPAEALVQATGRWTLRGLCLLLAVTPVRVMTGEAAWGRFRRMLGLFVFFYACMHLLAYSGFDMAFEVEDIARDIAKRPFILVGFVAWAVLVVLAVTSFNRVVRALGARWWRRLHQGVYAVAVLSLLHFFWKRTGKNDVVDVYLYASIIAVLLGWRVWRAWRLRQAARMAAN